MSQWEDFYATHLPPSDFEDNRTLLKEFVERHNKQGQRVALVTVGGFFKYVWFLIFSLFIVRRDDSTSGT